MCADVEKHVNELQNWLKTQPQLPQKIDKWMLKRFISCLEGDLEAAQNLIMTNYKMRNKHDHIFLKRDPMDESSQRMLQTADFLALPNKTPDNYSLILYRLQDFDSEKFNFTEAIKVYFMMLDCRFAVLQNEDSSGEVVVYDMTGFSLKHLARVTLSSLRIFMKFVQESHPCRVKHIHILNAPSYLDRVMSVVKPFMKSELIKLLHFHLPNADTPYKFFPRHMLPEEYGGNAGKLADLREYWLTKLKETREILIDESRWKMGKSKTPNSNAVHNIRKLEID